MDKRGSGIIIVGFNEYKIVANMTKRIYRILGVASVLLYCFAGVASSEQPTQLILEGWTLVSPIHYGKEIGQKTVSFGKTGDQSFRIFTKSTRKNEYTYTIEFLSGSKRQTFEVCSINVPPSSLEYMQDVYIYQLDRTSLVKALHGVDEGVDYVYGGYDMFVFQDGIWKKIWLPITGDVYRSKNGSYLYYAVHNMYGDLNVETRYFGLAMNESVNGLEIQTLEIPLFSSHEKRMISPREYAWGYEKGLRVDKGNTALYCALFGKQQLAYFRDALNIERNPKIAAEYKTSIPFIKSEAKKNIDLILEACKGQTLHWGQGSKKK